MKLNPLIFPFSDKNLYKIQNFQLVNKFSTNFLTDFSISKSAIHRQNTNRDSWHFCSDFKTGLHSSKKHRSTTTEDSSSKSASSARNWTAVCSSLCRLFVEISWKLGRLVRRNLRAGKWRPARRIEQIRELRVCQLFFEIQKVKSFLILARVNLKNLFQKILFTRSGWAQRNRKRESKIRVIIFSNFYFWSWVSLRASLRSARCSDMRVDNFLVIAPARVNLENLFLETAK